MPPPDKSLTQLSLAHQQHGRRWHENLYCYPVVSRRSKGLSIGINLNPDKACNFDCIYCQVDRTTPPAVRGVDFSVLSAELHGLLGAAADQSLFQDSPFDCLPLDQRVVRDLAFSGDGEPTSFPRFDDAVELAARAKRDRRLTDTKLILITDACYLSKSHVRRGLQIFDENNGEVWAKLDAGTEEYYRLINRPNFSLRHVIDNIIDAARVRPLVIQSLWMNVHGQPPPDAEISAFCDRLGEIVSADGKIKLVQVYTIARRTTEAFATALHGEKLLQIAEAVGQSTGLPVETYPGVET